MMNTTCRVPRSRAWGLALALALTTLAPAVHADAPVDTVFLNDGGRVRGSITEDDPKQGVTIKLLDGSIRKVRRDQIKNVEYGQSTPSTPAPTPAPPPAPPAAPPAPSEAGLTLKLDSDNQNATLEQVLEESSATAWGYGGTASAYGRTTRTACTVPCNRPIVRNAKYFISGRGVKDSSMFVLPDDVKEIHVKAGSTFAWGMGLVSLSVGIVGVCLTPLAIVPSLQGVAIASGVAGGALSVLGIVLMVANGTDVTSDTGRDLAQHRKPFLTQALSLGTTGLQF